MCYSRQTRYYHAEGHPTRPSYSWCLMLIFLLLSVWGSISNVCKSTKNVDKELTDGEECPHTE